MGVFLFCVSSPGFPTKVFNIGDYRRRLGYGGVDKSFFEKGNEKGQRIRSQMVQVSKVIWCRRCGAYLSTFLSSVCAVCGGGADRSTTPRRFCLVFGEGRSRTGEEQCNKMAAQAFATAQGSIGSFVHSASGHHSVASRAERTPRDELVAFSLRRRSESSARGCARCLSVHTSGKMALDI